MRCVACDKLLSDFEATRKSATTLEYLDLCSSCISYVDILTLDREDLQTEESCTQEIDNDYF